MSILDSDIKYLPGVGPKKAEILEREISVSKFEDLLYYFPYKYIDRSKIYKVEDIKQNSTHIQLRGKFCCLTEEGQQHKKYLHGEFFDETGAIDVVWFKHIKWVKEKIDYKKEYILFGKPTEFRDKFSISHPEFVEVSEYIKQIKGNFIADYNTTEKMKNVLLNSRGIAKLVREIFEKKPVLTEVLSGKILELFHLPNINEAIFNIHYPQSIPLLEASRKRFKFEELLINQLSLLKQKVFRTNTFKGYIFEKVGENFMYFFENNLSFELTNAQKRVIKEIRSDFKSGKQCNRLLQGDVGSGKTVVALMCMLIAVDNGFQACLMAPTEILAQQHFESVNYMLRDMNVNVKLLTGSTKTKQRRIIDEELNSGQLNILIGTHALIENKVKFKNLGLAIIDEQHRFGVAQRAKLREKSEIPPHIIVMTATPIPRTLSMTLYGDLDLSVIDELPANRKPIKTYHLFDNKRFKLYEFITKEIKKGRQVYFVFPLIKESETLDYKNLEDGYENLKTIFEPSGFNVSIVHGQMHPDDKKQQMDNFVEGRTQILVATTVIEVGVNVPNASVMIIESAERFGLAQLHQLRGRVGRGAEQSFCFLMTAYKLSADSKKRIETMVRTNNGFEIADVDMRLRGPGDIFGTQQSGMPINFKIANLLTDGRILLAARKVAEEILNEDPDLKKDENILLAYAVKKEINKSWGIIS